jgi:hypothetical protein
VVTLALFALGFALFHSREGFAVAVASSLWITAVLGVLPLAVGVAVSRGWGRKTGVAVRGVGVSATKFP